MGRRAPRGSLSREAIVDAALAVIDRAGVDNLSVRGVAEELQRPPMSLYTHLDSKQELIDLSFERLVERLFEHHVARASWQAEVEGCCRHVRRVLLDHPNWIALLTRVRVPVTGLRAYEHLLGLMTSDGFRPHAAMFAFSALMSHAVGSVLVERLMAGHPSIPEQRMRLVRDVVAGRPKGSYPLIASVASKFDRWTFDRVFDVGLHSLVTGLDETDRRPALRRARERRDPARARRAGSSLPPRTGGSRRA